MTDHDISPGGGVVATLFDFIATASVASIDTGASGLLLPPSYSMLWMFLTARTDEAVNKSVLDITLNNDSGSNYYGSFLAGDGGVVSAGAQAVNTSFQAYVNGASQAANVPAQVQLEIHNYGGTTFNKVMKALYSAVDETTTASHANLTWYLWNYHSTSAINRIKFVPHTAAKNFVAGSRLTIYGMP